MKRRTERARLSAALRSIDDFPDPRIATAGPSRARIAAQPAKYGARRSGPIAGHIIAATNGGEGGRARWQIRVVDKDGRSCVVRRTDLDWGSNVGAGISITDNSSARRRGWIRVAEAPSGEASIVALLEREELERLWHEGPPRATAG